MFVPALPSVYPPAPVALKATCALYDLAKPHVRTNHRDLLHDRQQVWASGGSAFICVARPTGTWLAVLYSAHHEAFPPRGQQAAYLFGSKDREGLVNAIANFVHGLAERHEDTRYRWFLHAGGGAVREAIPADGVAMVDA